jgi:hypothetical protein
LWLRDQEELDSKTKGFVATNIDYLWRNWKTGDWMLVEEKRHGSEIRFAQKIAFDILDRVCQEDPQYHGFHVLIFENTSPEDGKIFLDGKEITVDDLLVFLQFQK